MIRPGKANDFNRVMEIYSFARNFMKNTGNPNQWGNNFPPEDLIREDIACERLFVFDENGVIHGSFAFILGNDPTYAHIDGAWLSDAPYGTIHRIAGDGDRSGILTEAVDFCRQRISHLRIDTHEDNKIMQHLIEKNGFRQCGVIYIEDGTPRIAYELLG